MIISGRGKYSGTRDTRNTLYEDLAMTVDGWLQYDYTVLGWRDRGGVRGWRERVEGCALSALSALSPLWAQRAI